MNKKLTTVIKKSKQCDELLDGFIDFDAAEDAETEL